MNNVLYLIAIAACVYAGFAGFPWWTLLPFATVFSVLFWMLKPATLRFALREAGIMYVVRFVAINVAMIAPVFGLGRLLAILFR